MGQEVSHPTSSTEEEDNILPKEDPAIIDSLPRHDDPNTTMQTIDEEQEQRKEPTRGTSGSVASSGTASAATIPAFDGGDNNNPTTTTGAYGTAWENSKNQPINNNNNNNNNNQMGGNGESDGKTNNNSNNNVNDPNHVMVDLDSMKDACYFLFPDKKARLSRFWLLLILASIIATSGICSDSAATVIGAMIVAPLMIPILGMMLSLVLSDYKNFMYSSMLVVSGVTSCCLIGFVFGLIVPEGLISSERNSQVSARTLPRLADLFGALATGAIGSIALVRKDIAGALPGVAISISLVPPLCVAGLTASIGDWNDAGNAMILWCTNFLSIQVTGVIVMYIYRVDKLAPRRRTTSASAVMMLTIFALLGLVAVPLTFTSLRLMAEAKMTTCLEDAVNRYAEPEGWKTTTIIVTSTKHLLEAHVILAGDPPFPKEDEIDGDTINQLCPGVDVLSVNFVPLRNIPLSS